MLQVFEQRTERIICYYYRYKCCELWSNETNGAGGAHISTWYVRTALLATEYLLFWAVPYTRHLSCWHKPSGIWAGPGPFAKWTNRVNGAGPVESMGWFSKVFRTFALSLRGYFLRFPSRTLKRLICKYLITKTNTLNSAPAYKCLQELRVPCCALGI